MKFYVITDDENGMKITWKKNVSMRLSYSELHLCKIFRDTLLTSTFIQPQERFKAAPAVNACSDHPPFQATVSLRPILPFQLPGSVLLPPFHSLILNSREYLFSTL